MLTTAIRRGIALGTACAGLSLVLTGGTAGAATKVAARVLSDTIVFSGTIMPGPVQGSFIVTSQKCSLASDQETTPVPCQLHATVTVPATGNPTGNFTVVSSDGQTQGAFTLTPISGTSSFALKGSGKEKDAPDPGQPAPPPYSATMSGTVTPNFATMKVNGKIKVFEATTAP
jgi:hypothetical protein